MPRVPLWVFIPLAIIYFTAARVDVMDVDASQYAEISREMMNSGDYLQVYDRGHDYLDKPPFLFWVSAVSMNIFGANNFGYRFPSILFALWALFALYRLTKLLYGEHTARMAALILGCCQGMFLMTNDVRTDTILMSWTITAIWLIKEWDIKRRLYYLLLGCAAIAFGMMTKGPVALMVPVFCFASDWILKREWRKFFQPQFLLGLVLIAVLLIPMCIGLYRQFDLHPEKLIDGKQGVSGLRFFFWTQSFGRITGENTWDNGAPFGFLFENMLWSFLPWILLLVAALILQSWELIRQRFRLQPHQEWLSTGGFIISYISLASSSYQLPHYIFVAFPLAAIMVSKLLKDFFAGRYSRLYRVMKPVQAVISVLLLLAALCTFTVVFKGTVWAYVFWFAGAMLLVYIMWNRHVAGKILWVSAVAIIGANIFMTNHFYYRLLQYQVGSKLGRVIRQRDIPAAATIIYKLDDPLNSLHFYARRAIRRNDTLSRLQSYSYFITGDGGIRELRQKGVRYTVLNQGKLFKVSELTPEFLSPPTRGRALKNYYLLKTQE